MSYLFTNLILGLTTGYLIKKKKKQKYDVKKSKICKTKVKFRKKCFGCKNSQLSKEKEKNKISSFATGFFFLIYQYKNQNHKYTQSLFIISYFSINF